jgi:hypothetical protein
LPGLPANVFQNGNNAGIKGSGVAKINIVNGAPQVTQRFGSNGFFWDGANNPRYGDVAACRDPNSDYIYALGGAPSSQTGFIAQSYVYRVRVRAENAFGLSKYEYWHGRAVGWNTTPLTDFNSETAVMWGVGQGQITYDNYYKCYVFVHCNKSPRSCPMRNATNNS